MSLEGALAVQVVRSEPRSWHFPVRQGKYREFSYLRPPTPLILARANAQNPSCLRFNSLQIRAGNFPGRTA
jgi:hypothetical protein